jgi:hypothetical protein
LAAIYKPITAFDFAKSFIKAMPLDRVQAPILNHINQMIWMRAPWRWTIGSMPTVDLTSNTQDYAISIPADFLYLVDAQVIETGTSQNTEPRDLHVEPVLPTTVGLIGQSSRIALAGANYRVSPVPPVIPAGKTFTVIGLYKKTAPIIGASNAHTAGVLVMDDEWAYVYEQGVLWLAYLYANDSRAGAAQVANGATQFTGQRGNFEAAMIAMEEREKLPEFNRRNEAAKEVKSK